MTRAASHDSLVSNHLDSQIDPPPATPDSRHGRSPNPHALASPVRKADWTVRRKPGPPSAAPSPQDPPRSIPVRACGSASQLTSAQAMAAQRSVRGMSGCLGPQGMLGWLRRRRNYRRPHHRHVEQVYWAGIDGEQSTGPVIAHRPTQLLLQGRSPWRGRLLLA